MVKKAIFWMSLLLITALLLPACTAASTPPAARKPLRVEYTIWDGDYTLLVAKEKGFFAKHGVEVEPVYYETFSKALPDISAKKIDAGLFALNDLLSVSTLTNVKGVMAYDSGGTSAVVSSGDVSAIGALIGKKIGVNLGSYGELFIREMLKSSGVHPQDVTLVNIDPENVIAKLSSGEISAGYVWDPYDKKAVEAGYNILYSSISSDTASLSPDVIVFREEVTVERGDEVRAFLAAWSEALEYRLAHPEECNQIIAKITDQTPQDVASSGNLKLYSLVDNRSLFDRKNDVQSTIYYAANANLDFLIARGKITIAPNLETILDPSFLQ